MIPIHSTLYAEGIICHGCGSRGRPEFQSLDTRGPSREGFPYQGYDPCTGHLFFRCTGCGLELEVNPLEFFHGPATVDSRPRRLRREKKLGVWLFLSVFGLMGTVLVQIILSW